MQYKYSLSGRKKDTSQKSIYLLFALWPFAAFLWALWTYHNKSSKRIVLWFLILYGLTTVIDIEGLDAFRLAENLKKVAILPFNDFFKIMGDIYAYDTSVDIFLPFLNFLISRFTDNYRFLFATFALIFGWFYLKNINFLYDRYLENRSNNTLIHLLFFAVIIPIFNINGFRYYTAALVFFYGAYNVIINGKKIYILFSLAASLIHFSFLSANFALALYFLIGNKNLIYYPLLVASILIPEVFTNLVPQIALKLGTGIQNRFDIYTNQNYVSQIIENEANVHWFITWYGKSIFYYSIFAILFIKGYYRNINQSKQLQNLYSFLLVFISFTNFGRQIPSFGRFQTVFCLFAFAYICLAFLEIKEKKLSLITALGLFPMLLYTAVVFRQGSETLNFWLFTPMPFPLVGSDLSVYQFLFN